MLLQLYAIFITGLLVLLFVVNKKQSENDWQHFNRILEEYRQHSNVKHYKYECSCGIFAIMPSNVAEQIGWRCIGELWKCPECTGLTRQYNKAFNGITDAPVDL